MGEYSTALSYYEKSLEIYQKSLPANHPHVLSVRESVDALKLQSSEKGKYHS